MKCPTPVIDIDGLAAVKDQLWAEAATLYFDGNPWWLDSVALNWDASEEQAERYDGDPWDEVILAWIDDRESVSIPEILGSCLHKRMDLWTQHDRNRVSRCLRANGWLRYRVGEQSSREWSFRKAEAE